MNRPAFIFLLIFGTLSPRAQAFEKTEAQYDSTLQNFEQHFLSEVSAAGGVLKVERNWDGTILNAFADRKGEIWFIETSGEMFRHPAITEDGFYAMLCHELGHHLAGAPFKPDIPWMSSEAQADLFAGQNCLRNLWENKNNSEKVESIPNVSTSLKQNCVDAFSQQTSANLCIRIGMAGLSFIEFNRLEHGYASETSPVRFDTPAPPSPMKLNYPRSQCRLEIFLAGALLGPKPAC